MKKLWFKLSNSRGSTALLLATMVSAGSLGVIYFTQKQAGQFLSGISQSMEDWEKHLVSRSAQTLASYLVAQSIIMCRSDGWRETQTSCKWSEVEGMEEPSNFKLRPLPSETELSYEGKYTIGDKEQTYKVTFQLVDWTDTSISALIGNIPSYVCRNKQSRSVIPNATCPAYRDSSNPSDQACENGKPLAPVPNSQCEYISDVDGDHYIVLIKVEVPWTDPVTGQNHIHTALSGIRRPMSVVSFEHIKQGYVCSLGCDVGKTAHFAPECRSGSRRVGDQAGIGSQILTVRNEGPGVLYKLSLMKIITELADQSKKIEISPDIIALARDKDVLLPGEKLKVEWFYPCPNREQVETIYRTGPQSRVSHAVRNEAVPFQRVVYALQFSTNSVGVHYSSEGEDLPPKEENVDAIIPYNRKGTLGDPCVNGYNKCSGNQISNCCQYVDIEPARIMSQMVSENTDTKAIQRTIKKTITISPPPPPPRVVGDGDGAPDGSDGASADGSDGAGN